MNFENFMSIIINNYENKKSFRMSALSINDGHNILKNILEKNKYKTIVEIGTFRGLTAAWMSYFVEKVITIDLKNSELLKRSKLNSNDLHPTPEEIINLLNIKNVDIITVKNDEEKIDFLKDKNFDFAYIDGDHFDGFIIDFDITKKCKNVLFHDYAKTKDGITTRVRNFVDNIGYGTIQDLGDFALWKS